MSTNYNLNNFELVTYKKKGKPRHVTNIHQLRNHPDAPPLDHQSITRRILSAKEDIIASDFYASVLASLKEGAELLDTFAVTEIVCFGLGQIGECTTSRYQLAFLLCLKELYQANTIAYDPVFTGDERDLLQSLDIGVLVENPEGKYRARASTHTLFYLPHCPRQLTNNLLWSNWGLNLANCIVVANSFARITDTQPINWRRSDKEVEFIFHIAPHMVELAVINSFKYFDIFNDTAIHVFPLEKLRLVASDIWDRCEEPAYDEDVEFITKALQTMGLPPATNVLRQITRELRVALPAGQWKDSLALNYIRKQYRKYETSDEQLCKAREEMKYVANTYLCYLRSGRVHMEIHNEFHGRGDRTVAETAKIVGFKLPHDPK